MTMKKYTWLFLCICMICVLCGFILPQSIESAERPNIVLIMADDMGYSDIGAFGGEIETPNLDRLAYNGLRFTNFYSENMCWPSRATMLTGTYSRTAVRDRILNPECVTMAELLRDSGYATYISGKWHLALDENPQSWPLQRGFQHFYGTLVGAGSFFSPATLMRDNRDAEHEFLNPDYYYTDAITDNAIQYIESTTSDMPLMLYVAYTAAHWPLHALPEDMAKYEGKYSAGWDQLRNERFARMKEIGVIPAAARLSPRDPDVPAWEDEIHKAWQERRMEVYAAQIDRMDQGIGRIVQSLDREGRLDNTLILFMIDNGGCHVEYEPDRTGVFLKETTRDGRPMRPGNLPDIMPGPEDTFQSYGRGWANAGNTPYRMFKQYNHEGGIRTPLIAHWPAKLQKSGAMLDQTTHLIDILPTILDITGVAYPETYAGQKIHAMDGLSLTPLLYTGKWEGHDALYWEHNRGQAIQRGEWKLVLNKDLKGPWELYHIATDYSELNNVATEHPDIVAELTKEWEAWSQHMRER
jgi:arylsulfatase A-like enzyme